MLAVVLVLVPVPVPVPVLAAAVVAAAAGVEFGRNGSGPLRMRSGGYRAWQRYNGYSANGPGQRR